MQASKQPVRQLNIIQELILRKLNKKERSIAYFRQCYQIIRGLCAAGYIKKTGGLHQRSAIMVSLTPKGQEYYDKHLRDSKHDG